MGPAPRRSPALPVRGAPAGKGIGIVPEKSHMKTNLMGRILAGVLAAAAKQG